MKREQFRDGAILVDSDPGVDVFGDFDRIFEN
jgi:hypothetical protein